MKNYYEIDGDITRIRINRRDGSYLWTIIDTVDLPIMDNIPGKINARWDDSTKSFYAKYNCKNNEKQTARELHRLLMNFPECRIDHKDHDTLNNRRCNLRPSTVSQNGGNSISRTGSSRFKGVFWDKKSNKWQAKIQIDRQGIYLGLFKDEIQAAKTYDWVAEILFGEFALLNFP